MPKVRELGRQIPEGRRMRHCFIRVFSPAHKPPGCSDLQTGVHYAGHVHGVEQICNSGPTSASLLDDKTSYVD